jgi:hypothetical protein
MRHKFHQAVQILSTIEQDSPQKTDRSWLNRSKIYSILRKRGWYYRKWKGEPNQWVEPLNIPF